MKGYEDIIFRAKTEEMQDIRREAKLRGLKISQYLLQLHSKEKSRHATDGKSRSK